jgi:hypothetical protein
MHASRIMSAADFKNWVWRMKRFSDKNNKKSPPGGQEDIYNRYSRMQYFLTCF